MIDVGEIRNTIDQDITALPAPFVVPQGVLLLAWWEDQPVGCVALGALDASTGAGACVAGEREPRWLTGQSACIFVLAFTCEVSDGPGGRADGAHHGQP